MANDNHDEHGRFAAGGGHATSVRLRAGVAGHHDSVPRAIPGRIGIPARQAPMVGHPTRAGIEAYRAGQAARK